MIIGIGHDLIELERVRQIMEQGNRERFLTRVFTHEELEQLLSFKGQRLIEHVAGRFALKEAVSKAFGCGIGASMSFQHIMISRQPTGKPVCVVEPHVLQKLGFEARSIQIHVTITHERSMASAFAVVEQRDSLKGE